INVTMLDNRFGQPLVTFSGLAVMSSPEVNRREFVCAQTICAQRRSRNSSCLVTSRTGGRQCATYSPGQQPNSENDQCSNNSVQPDQGNCNHPDVGHHHAKQAHYPETGEGAEK